MGDRNLDLPDDLLFSKPSDQLSPHKVSQDHAVSENAIPLSLQRLNNVRQGDTKLEVRSPSAPSLGNAAADVNQKEDGSLDVVKDKKRSRGSTETDPGRCWHEEERDTSLLGIKDDRKTDFSVDNSSVGEGTEKVHSSHAEEKEKGDRVVKKSRMDSVQSNPSSFESSQSSPASVPDEQEMESGQAPSRGSRPMERNKAKAGGSSSNPAIFEMAQEHMTITRQLSDLLTKAATVKLKVYENKILSLDPKAPGLLEKRRAWIRQLQAEIYANAGIRIDDDDED